MNGLHWPLHSQVNEKEGVSMAMIEIDFVQGKAVSYNQLSKAIETEKSDEVISAGKLKQNTLKKKLDPDSILPAEGNVELDIAIDHASEPIKKMEDIIKISKYLIEKKRYRDNMLFIVGINFGLRVSDLRMLRFANLINDDLTFKETFAILEKKTKNTRKRKKNRYITINDAVIEAVTLYIENTPGVKLSDYMFVSESNNTDRSFSAPLTRRGIEYILKGINKDLELGIHMATHTLRKTFAYHQMVMSGNDPRKLLLLQKMFGHSTSAQTLDYIGITSEEIEDAYKKLNLGSENYNYLCDTKIVVNDTAAI